LIRTGYFSKKRARVLYLLLFGFTAIQLRLVYLQFYMHDHYSDKAVQQSTNTSHVPAKRGRILDRQGKVIAESYESQSIWTDPKLISDQEKLKLFLSKASTILEEPYERLAKACQKKSRFVWLFRHLNYKQFQALEQTVKDTPGIYFREEWARFYRSGEMMSPVVGVVGTEHQGLTGLEQRYNKTLRGHAGKVSQVRDAKRMVLKEEVIQVPVPGNDVTLTLDMGIQTILYNELKKGYEEFEPESASGMVMDVQTGQILAMATLPAHVPGEAIPKGLKGLKPRMVVDIFEPGSTMKPLIYAGLLEKKLGHPEEIVDCTGGAKKFGRRVINEFRNKSYGKISFENVIVKSSNIGTAYMAMRLGDKNIYNLLKGLGFGEKNYLPFSGEPRGMLSPLERWTPYYSNLSIPMGHEIGVTMTQMLRAYAALGNGGYVLQPSLELNVRDYEGVIQRQGGSLSVGRIFSASTCRQTLIALQKVVEEGTARRCRSELYDIGGKTGTTEKLIDGKYAKNNKNIGSFVGLAPIEQPRIVVMIAMDSATKGTYTTGGVVSAPVAKLVIENVLQYLGVPTKLADEDV
jgi:cell division protein FtsI/penicillin-binding protein 2